MPGRVILCLIPFLQTHLAASQSPYRPFPEGNATWIEQHSWMSGENRYTECDRILRSGNDTTISGISYHSIVSTGQCTEFTVPIVSDHLYYNEPQSTAVIFRQSVEDRKVYAYDSFAEAELLWFDFGLDVGIYPTTLNTIDLPPDQGLSVVALDSIELGDGWHRKWVLGNIVQATVEDSAFCTVIEGVGPTYGVQPVYGFVPPFEWGDRLNCHGIGSVVTYNSGWLQCALTQGLSTYGSQDTFTAFPNPVNDVLTIAGSVGSTLRYTILDPQGRQIQNGNTTGTIDLRDLDPAPYFIQLWTADEGVGSLRIVKQ